MKGEPGGQIMPADPNRVRDVFLAAVELPPEQRPGLPGRGLRRGCRAAGRGRSTAGRKRRPRQHPRTRISHPTDATVVPASRDRRTPGPTSATAAFDPDAPSPTAIATEVHRPDRSTETLCPTRSRCHHGTQKRRPPRPSRRGPRRAKGSAPSSPAGTRSSR